MKISANKPCPCQSGRKAKGCCLPIIRGVRAPSPEALMRSRYTAYAIGSVSHILSTTHPDGPHARPDRNSWAEEIRSFCEAMSFEALEVHSSKADHVTGEVFFTACLRQDGIDRSFTERSRFLLKDGHWLYHSALPSD